MFRRTAVLLVILFISGAVSLSQVRIRILTEEKPSLVFFKTLFGRYTVFASQDDSLELKAGETAVLALYGHKVALRTRNGRGTAYDSLFIKPSGPEARFSVFSEGQGRITRIYSGDLKCIPDLETLILVNSCDIEPYIAGVVKAEGGNGKNAGYFRTQAIIARTYTYRYFNRHMLDRYNLCDDTHCQVYGGITSDSTILRAVYDTRDLVITAADSSLIIAAFHSNCGGETSPSEFIWPAKLDYLIRITDPYCVNSRNAKWVKELPSEKWAAMLRKNGYKGRTDSSELFAFRQPSRVQDYVTGGFRLPFSVIRKDLDLRSSWFSVIPEGDTLKLEGRGYGHGVGLCQEGAMVMAANGFDYAGIIGFYYPGVLIMKISAAKKNDDDNRTVANKQGN
jgi:stage II sporulation protein D